MPRKKKESNQYWTNEHEQLVVAYQSSTGSERDLIYSQLRPVLLKMSEIILKRYIKLPIGYEIDELLLDAESHVITKVIPKFNPQRDAKAYSFIGTSIKNYFITAFAKRNGEKVERVCIHEFEDWEDNTEPSIGYSLTDYSFEEMEHGESMEDLRQRTKEHVRKLLKSKWLANSERGVLECVYNLVSNEINYSKLYATYYITTRLNLRLRVIHSYLEKNNLHSLFTPKFPLKRLRQIIEEHEAKHGVYPNSQRDALNNYRNVSNEKQSFRFHDKTKRNKRITKENV